MFVKISVLKPQGTRSKCTYGVALSGEYLQVTGRWQRRCLCIWCNTWNRLGTSSPISTHVTRWLRLIRQLRVICWLCHRSFSIPTKKTIPVYAHLGTHAMSAVVSPKWKIIIVTYERTEVSSDVLPLMAVYVTCTSGTTLSAMFDSWPRSLENEQGKLW